MERRFTMPEMILWTATRVALGTGIGMLVSRGMSNDARKSTGIALTVMGALTTIPLVMAMVGKRSPHLEIQSAA